MTADEILGTSRGVFLMSDADTALILEASNVDRNIARNVDGRIYTCDALTLTDGSVTCSTATGRRAALCILAREPS